jgi:gamma-glutamylcysteine synthetase
MERGDGILEQEMPQRPRVDDAEPMPVESRAQLVEYLAAGCKSPEQFRLGSEQEMFVCRGDDYSPAEYDGPEPGIKALLESMTRYGWQPIAENGLPIALMRDHAAWERVGSWTPEQRHALELGVAEHGFRTPFRDGTVQQLALWMLELARQGLQRRGRQNGQGQDESCYLEPLEEAARSGRTFAEEHLRRFEDQWRGDMDIALPAMCEETFS